MKKIRDTIENYVLQAERRWKTLPAKRQRFFTKLFFAGYTVLTVIVMISIWMSTANKTNTMFIGHISTISDHSFSKKAVGDHVNSTIKK
jgi:cell division septal protein FtsQ